MIIWQAGVEDTGEQWDEAPAEVHTENLVLPNFNIKIKEI